MARSLSRQESQTGVKFAGFALEAIRVAILRADRFVLLTGGDEMKCKHSSSSSAWPLAIFVCILMFGGNAGAVGPKEKALYRFQGR
jgi:hypothetical protein